MMELTPPPIASPSPPSSTLILGPPSLFIYFHKAAWEPGDGGMGGWGEVFSLFLFPGTREEEHAEVLNHQDLNAKTGTFIRGGKN